MDKSDVSELIYEVIDELNDQSVTDEPLAKSPDTVLYGDNGGLDSLGLVHLVTITEQKIEDRFGKSVSLVDDQSITSENGPFHSVRTLTEYVKGLVS